MPQSELYTNCSWNVQKTLGTVHVWFIYCPSTVHVQFMYSSNKVFVQFYLFAV